MITSLAFRPLMTSDIDFNGELASAVRLKQGKNEKVRWCQDSIDEVKSNMSKTGYPCSRIQIIEGDVQLTIPNTLMPAQISILRLDTDWYASTLHELHHLFPLVVPGGFVVVDDYGHWQGAQRAVDEYLSKSKLKPYLHRVDYTCRVFQKPA